MEWGLARPHVWEALADALPLAPRPRPPRAALQEVVPALLLGPAVLAVSTELTADTWGPPRWWRGPPEAFAVWDPKVNELTTLIS